MTPRQRVRAVLNRRTADRMPIDCGGTDVTGLHGSAYNALKAHLGIGGGTTRLFNLYMQPDVRRCAGIRWLLAGRART